MKLSELFEKVAVKRLSAVETDSRISHQHELNGVKGLVGLFGKTETKRNFPAKFLYLNDEALDSEDGTITWYDARASHPSRTEYRLYYSSSEIMAESAAGDLLVIGFDGRKVTMIVAEAGSDAEAKLLWLFGLQHILASRESGFEIRDFTASQHELSYMEQSILEELGIETSADYFADIEKVLTRFGGKFPATAEFSLYARELSGVDSSRGNPDETLLAWWSEEEKLFRALERHIVQVQLDRGFRDVDQFVEFAKSVLNRRNSRAGHAFENHLAQIFRDHDIMFDKGKQTEFKSRPDFIFPSIEHYQSASERKDLIPLLTMLAAKTSCKDRWRQITKEAALIEKKHLITLEPAISPDQTNEMQRASVQLIVPQGIMSSYLPDQRSRLMNLQDFLSLLSEKQERL